MTTRTRRIWLNVGSMAATIGLALRFLGGDGGEVLGGFVLTAGLAMLFTVALEHMQR